MAVPPPPAIFVLRITRGVPAHVPVDSREGGGEGFGKWGGLNDRKARKGSSNVPQDKMKEEEG